MSPHEQLRKIAAENRDKAITAARIAYKQAIRRIEELESSISGGDGEVIGRRRDRPVIQMICDLMPRDRAFTQAELIDLLQATAPNRKFHIPTIPATFQRLMDRGVIRRIRRKRGGSTLWAAVDSSVVAEPFGAMSIGDVAELVLQETGPLRMIELAVAIQRRGYRPEAEPKTLVASLTSTLRRNPQRFSRGEDGRWGVAKLT